MKILLIDDNAPFRRLMSRMLEGAGYEVEEAANGAIGVSCYRQRPSALVITDIVMPVMEGLETILALRRLDPQVRIMAVTATQEERGAYLRTATMFGAVRTLHKPFSESEFLAAVNAALEK